MIEVSIDPGLVASARSKAAEMGLLNNSIAQGQGSLSGFIGEFLAADHLGAEVRNTYDYDLVMPDGKRIDVKTKRTNYKPKPEYSCSIAAFNTRQQCDIYFFVRVKNDLSIAWLLGGYDKTQYFKDATFHRAGDVDPANNFTFKADCYNLPISALTL